MIRTDGERLAVMETKVDAVDERLERLEEKSDAVSQKLDAIALRLETQVTIGSLMKSKWFTVVIVFIVGNMTGIGGDKVTEVLKLVFSQ